MQKRHEYFKALEEERRKIETFQRDLPLCLHLVTQAIETYKQQLSGTTTDCTLNGESDCSEQTTSGDEGVVFEGFIPIKRSCSSLQQVQEQEKEDDDDDGHELESNINDKFKKSDWLRSVQLWSQSPDPPTTTNNKKEMSANCDGVHVSGNTSTAPSLCSTPKRVATRKNEGGKEGGRGEARKARRCWSPELHRRFIHALQQLGGPHVATPKQIRDLMNVDGLTNDEVKSHLQKYRLHSRRPTLSLHNNASTQPPHFVVVGGIWVPPPDASTALSSGKLDPFTKTQAI